MSNNRAANVNTLKDSIQNKSVDDYLNQLQKELKGSDPALIQDALSDAEEYLRSALGTAKKDIPDIDDAEALESIFNKYGISRPTSKLAMATTYCLICPPCSST